MVTCPRWHLERSGFDAFCSIFGDLPFWHFFGGHPPAPSKVIVVAGDFDPHSIASIAWSFATLATGLHGNG